MGACAMGVFFCSYPDVYGDTLATSKSAAFNREKVCARTVTFEEFRAIALQNSPLVAEIDTNFVRDIGQAYDTEVFKNPEVQFEQVFTRARLNGDNDPQTSASLSLPLRLSTLGSKARVAQLLREAGNIRKRAALFELNQRLVLGYVKLYSLQQSSELLDQALTQATTMSDRGKHARMKGLLSDSMFELLQGERYRIESQNAGIRASIAALQFELTNLLGTPCTIKASAPFELSTLPSFEQLVLRANENHINDVVQNELLVALRSEQERLANLDALPEIVPRIAYQHTNDGGDFIGAGVSIPLPFFNRNKSAKMVAKAESATVRQKQSFFSNQGREAQISALRNAAMYSAEQVRIFKEKVIPSYENALQAQEKQYNAGTGDLSLVWQTLRSLTEAQREYSQLWLAAVTSRVQLEILIGEEV
jgi:cobalt-zinc-cadmium efflux system outer membrane protein